MNIIRGNGRIMARVQDVFALHDFAEEVQGGQKVGTCRFHLGAGPCQHGFQLDKAGSHPDGEDNEEMQRFEQHEFERHEKKRATSYRFRDHALDMAMSDGSSRTEDGDFIFTFRMSRVLALEAELVELDNRIQSGEIIPAVIVRSVGT